MGMSCTAIGCSVEVFGLNTRCSFHQFGGPGEAVIDKDRLVKSQGFVQDGFNPSEATRKDGKNRMDLVMTGFPKALLAMGECMTWALSKGYNVDDWHNVPDPVRAYTGAMMRHLLKEMGGETHDEESKLLHAVHTAWNAMARLEMILRGKTL